MLKPLKAGIALTIALTLMSPAIFADTKAVPTQGKNTPIVKPVKQAATVTISDSSEKKTITAKVKAINENYMTVTDNNKKEYLVFLDQFINAKGFKDLGLKEGIDVTLNGSELKIENDICISFSDASKADGKVNIATESMDIEKAIKEGKIKLIESNKTENGNVEVYNIEDGDGQIGIGTIAIASEFKSDGKTYDMPKIDENTNMFHAESITCNGKTINQVIPEAFKKAQ